jgi:anthranilate synthase component 1
MKPPFDIAADLDTPVSAYLKLAPFRPRFLLESVEGGERLARYSFIGFGDCLEVQAGLRRVCTSAECTARPGPTARPSFLMQLRARWRRRRSRKPEISGVPLSGGLVGYTAYDAVRYFEHLPGRVATRRWHPHCALRGATVAAGV